MKALSSSTCLERISFCGWHVTSTPKIHQKQIITKDTILRLHKCNPKPVWPEIHHVTSYQTRDTSVASIQSDSFPQQPMSPPSPDIVSTPTVWTRYIAETLLPTRHGKFRLRGYRHTTDGGITFTEPSAIISGSVDSCSDVIVRVHDACFTSEVLGSLKCDCREQLELALESIQNTPPGIVIYLQQEGRGIGLANKIAAYALQEKGLDTVDANRALGLPDDCREYSAVKHILEELGVKSIRLMTNNPRKMTELEGLGITVTGRLPCIVKSQKYNQGYLSAKQRRMRHMLGSWDEPDTDNIVNSSASGGSSSSSGSSGNGGVVRPRDADLDGSFCFWNHEGEPGPAGIPLQPIGNVVLKQQQDNSNNVQKKRGKQ